MSADYRLRPVTSADTDQILALMTLCLGSRGRIPRTRDFWEWKHSKNPFGPSFSLAAEQDGKIIGLRMFMRWMWVAGEQNFPAVRAVDTVTHPDWRGRGIFSRLTSMVLEDVRKAGISFVFNTPNRFSRPGYLKLGWRRVARLPMRIRPFSPMRYVFQRPSKHSEKLAERSAPLKDLLAQIDLEHCLRAMNSDTRLHTLRTRDYLQWRYSDIPGFEYSAEYQTNDHASALLIYRNRTRRHMQETSFSELLTSPGEEGIRLGYELLNETIRKTTSYYAIALAAGGTGEDSFLKRSWFIPVPGFGPILTIKPLGPSSKNMLDWTNWRCSVGDFEIF